MWRKRCGTHALDELRERLVGEPAIYILFPEGTRARDGKMGKFKPGLGRIVAASEVPVVPCHLAGAFQAKWQMRRRNRDAAGLRVRVNRVCQNCG